MNKENQDENQAECPGCTAVIKGLRYGSSFAVSPLVADVLHVPPCPASPYKILYWDKFNGYEGDGHEHVFNGEPEDYDIESVLKEYADNDGDGHTDGLYNEGGHPFIVKRPDSSLSEWEVYGEPTVTYSACLVKNLPDPEPEPVPEPEGRPVPAQAHTEAVDRSAYKEVEGAAPELEWFPGLDSVGDPIGYVLGHCTRAEIVRAAIASGADTEDFEANLAAGDTSPDEEVIWHGWIRKTPAAHTNEEFDERWSGAGPGPGAFSVTMWLMTDGGPWNGSWVAAPKCLVCTYCGQPDWKTDQQEECAANGSQSCRLEAPPTSGVLA